MKLSCVQRLQRMRSEKESSNTVLLIPETFENGSVPTSTVKNNAPVPGEVDACDKNGEVTIYGGDAKHIYYEKNTTKIRSTPKAVDAISLLR